MDIRRIDLFQLHCLAVLVTERHVTRAADKLGLTQAKLSNTLGILRKRVGDPLLVRTRQGMNPTPIALELTEHIRELLAKLDRTVASRDFDPAVADVTFKILTLDSLAMVLIGALISMLRREAPNVSLLIGQLQLDQYAQALELRDADLIVGYVNAPPQTLHICHLFDMEYVCIVSRDHPFIQGALSMDEYLGAAHATLSFGQEYSPYLSERIVDSLLATQGSVRRKVLGLPWGLAVPEIVAGSDLIATVPIALAKHMAAWIPLQVLPLPFLRPPTVVSMLWHPRAHRDAPHEWLRAKIRIASDTARNLDAVLARLGKQVTR